MTPATYHSRISRLRLERNYWQQQTALLAENALQKAYDDLTALLETSKGGSVSGSLYASKRRNIELLIFELRDNLDFANRQGMKQASEIISNLYSNTVGKFTADLSVSVNASEVFGTVPQDAVRKAVQFTYENGSNYSRQIFQAGVLARNGINDIIVSGVARGQSAVEMSKELRRFMVDPEISEGTSWTTGVRKSVTGRGTIHYNALRLARSTINNVYRETMVESNSRSPVTKGVKWNLSASHPRPDICNLWASLNSYGFEAGGYPANAAPIEHPNGFCFFTDILRPPKEWNNEKEEPEYREPSKAEINKILEGLSEVEKETIMDYHKSVRTAISKNQ